MLKYFLVLASALILMSCASLTEDECRAGNWESIGFVDGTNGRLQSYIAEHGKACSDFGVVPDTATWLRGRLEGLKTYCTPQSVYEVGRRGREMNPVCSAEQASDLKLANFYGLRYYEIESKTSELRFEKLDILEMLTTNFIPPLTPDQEQLRSFYLQRVVTIDIEIIELEAELPKYAVLP